MIREAQTNDIPQLHGIRMSVKENVLNNPALVTPKDYERFLTTDGKGWVWESGRMLLGFAILDLTRNNVWALFVHPEQERKGIGKALHSRMLDWFFQSGRTALWLSTAPGTRAASFYKKAGWNPSGFTGDGEIKFELTALQWEVHR